MAIRYGKTKLAPKQFARLVFAVGLDSITSYWSERHEDSFENMSERERQEVERHIETIAERIYRMVDTPAVLDALHAVAKSLD